MTTFTILAGLFWSAFLAATILPGASEILLIAAIAEGGVDPVSAVVVAGIGNTLGSVTNWILGRYFVGYSDRKWFPVPKSALARAEAVFQKYGAWTLLLAWWPVGGDALTLAAGFLKVRLLTFTLLVGAGKFARYAVVAATTLWVDSAL